MTRRTAKRRTHCNLRVVKADGRITSERVEVMRRCPIRVRCYSPGEWSVLMELALLIYAKKDGHLSVSHAGSAFMNQLHYTKAETSGDAHPTFQVGTVVRQLTQMGVLEQTGKGASKWAKILVVTEKGRRHIRRQSKRLRLAAEKLVYTDVLDRLGRAAG